MLQSHQDILQFRIFFSFWKIHNGLKCTIERNHFNVKHLRRYTTTVQVHFWQEFNLAYISKTESNDFSRKDFVVALGRRILSQCELKSIPGYTFDWPVGGSGKWHLITQSNRRRGLLLTHWLSQSIRSWVPISWWTWTKNNMKYTKHRARFDSAETSMPTAILCNDSNSGNHYNIYNSHRPRIQDTRHRRTMQNSTSICSAHSARTNHCILYAEITSWNHVNEVYNTANAE